MTRSLPLARAEFIKAMSRDTGRTDQPRFVAVLDAMIEWSLKHPQQLRFREDTREGVVSFECVDSKMIFWTAHPRRGDVPKLELLPRAASVLSADERETVMNALNAYTRDTLTADDKLRIGFSALKNLTARSAVLALMERQLTLVS